MEMTVWRAPAGVQLCRLRKTPAMRGHGIKPRVAIVGPEDWAPHLAQELRRAGYRISEIVSRNSLASRRKRVYWRTKYTRLRLWPTRAWTPLWCGSACPTARLPRRPVN